MYRSDKFFTNYFPKYKKRSIFHKNGILVKYDKQRQFDLLLWLNFINTIIRSDLKG